MEEQARRFGRYQVLAEVGRGAMGVVYKAQDPRIGRLVAIKTVAGAAAARGEFLARFTREAQAAGRLSHPHIVTVYDAGEEGAEPFIAMEFVEGETLEARLRSGGPLPWREAVQVAADVADALAYAHAHGIVHRDIKPANIMLTPDGRAKVMDFGVARLATSHLTQEAAAIGTPSYMAPEQVLGRPADARTDLFALGVVCYEMLTGEKPFGGPDLATVAYRIAHEDPLPLGSARRDLPDGLQALVDRCLAKDPADRPAGALELLQGLKALAEVSREAAPALDSDRTRIAVHGAGASTTGKDGRSGAGDLAATVRAAMARFPAPREAARWTLDETGRLARSGWAWAGRLPGQGKTALILLGISGIAILVALVLFLTDPAQEAARRIRQGRPQEAVALLADLEAKQGARAQTRALLGQAYLAAGERKAALGAFRRALEMDSRYQEDRDLLAGLVQLLGHGETGGDAADLLVSIGRPAVPPLRGAVESERYRLRWNAAKALERLAEPVDLVALYILDLEREDCLTRRHAAIRLGEAKDRRAVPALLRAKEKPLIENFCMFGALDEALAKLTTR
ncbi:MAG: protein kinase [candidate division NC10 bacterium]|nr:protein kinase [candidate division NC10 bacterium]